jgi:hypothetical protein
VIRPSLERKNSEAFARNLPEPIVSFSARTFTSLLAPMNDASEAFKSRPVSGDIAQ